MWRDTFLIERGYVDVVRSGQCCWTSRPGTLWPLKMRKAWKRRENMKEMSSFSLSFPSCLPPSLPFVLSCFFSPFFLSLSLSFFLSKDAYPLKPRVIIKQHNGHTFSHDSSMIFLSLTENRKNTPKPRSRRNPKSPPKPPSWRIFAWRPSTNHLVSWDSNGSVFASLVSRDSGNARKLVSSLFHWRLRRHRMWKCARAIDLSFPWTSGKSSPNEEPYGGKYVVGVVRVAITQRLFYWLVWINQ